MMKRNIAWVVVCLAVLMGLYACGGDSKSSTPAITATVTGTVTLNTSVTAKKWYVAIDADGNGSNGWVASASGTVTGSTITYTIQNVPAGTYYLYTVTDMDGTWGTGSAGPGGSGDYIGVYPNWNNTLPAYAGLTVASADTVTANLTTIVYP